MANKYKKGGTAIGFKSAGSGLQIGERRLTEQRKREIDAVRLAKEQAKAAEALDRGADTARKFISKGIIEAAYLSLQNQKLVVEH